MNIKVAILDHSHADVTLREQFSFTKSSIEVSLEKIIQNDEVYGAVIISTCNRTELYISTKSEISPVFLLCELKNLCFNEYSKFFIEYSGIDACRHLTRLACGIESKIFGEDQIISQVKEAFFISKEQNTLDYELNLLFKTSITTAKKIKSSIKLAKAEKSLGDSTLNLVRKYYESAKVLVIGNGEMGRLVAKKLTNANFDVCMTIRKYKRGEIIIPANCSAIDYDKRFEKLHEVDVVISATKSPHYTISADKLPSNIKKNLIFIDLAMPRDIDPEISNTHTVFDVDDFETKGSDLEILAAEKIIKTSLDEMISFYNFKKVLPEINEISENTTNYVVKRMENHIFDSKSIDFLEQTTKKAISKIFYDLRDNLDTEDFFKCINALKQGEKY